MTPVKAVKDVLSEPVPVIPIADIDIGERYREEMGDVAALAKSIDDLGLLHPVVITADRKLVAGARRIAACQQLGFDEIEVRVITGLDELPDLMQAEMDENKCRKDFTTGEARKLFNARKKLLDPVAKETKTANLKQSKAKTPAAPNGAVPRSGRVRDAAAAGTGKSGDTLARAEKIASVAADESEPKSVREVAKANLKLVDNDEKPVNTALKEVKEAQAKANEQLGQAKALASASRALMAAAKSLETAFPEGTENFDSDVNPEMILEHFKLMRGAATRINKVGNRFKDIK